MKLPEAFREELAAVVRPQSLEFREEPLRAWTVNTLDSPRRLLGIATPHSQEEVHAVVKLCIKYKVPYYPVSSGKNWGYGGATPVLDDMLLIDLSKLKRIVEFNAQLAYVVVEPGVTQQDLYDFMQKHGHDFMVPVTGAGPHASLLGNALERGYGIIPIEDHFLSLLGLKAVLPNGMLYRSPLEELGGTRSDPVFKWNIGPYLDGLFTQGNVGIVLEGTIALAQRAQNVTQFLIFLDDQQLEAAVQAIQELKHKLGGLIGGINLMNQRRLLSMAKDQKWLPPWMIAGALYGPDEVVHGAIKIIRRACRPFARKIICLDRRKVTWLRRLISYLPFKNLKESIFQLGRTLSILEGRPSDIALTLAYLKNTKGPPTEDMNPDRDECGLIWFSPLVPLEPAIIRKYVQCVTRICLAHDIDPLITLSAISPRCVDSTIPILFSKQKAGDAAKAKACYAELLEECRRMGLFPYRLTIDQMNSAFENETIPAFWMAQKIKEALDPDHLMAPGRYIHQKKQS